MRNWSCSSQSRDIYCHIFSAGAVSASTLVVGKEPNCTPLKVRGRQKALDCARVPSELQSPKLTIPLLETEKSQCVLIAGYDHAYYSSPKAPFCVVLRKQHEYRACNAFLQFWQTGRVCSWWLEHDTTSTILKSVLNFHTVSGVERVSNFTWSFWCIAAQN